jgi:uncharacterized protein YndB with AHSA1/START domain
MSNNGTNECASLWFEYAFAEPPHLVWAALTEPDLLALWLMPNDIKAEVGHNFTFCGVPTPSWDGVVHCEVLEVELHRRFSYRWCSYPPHSHADTGALNTTVVWTLLPSDNGGTKLTLEHSGFEPDSFVLNAMGNGWIGKLARRLRDVVAALKR